MKKRHPSFVLPALFSVGLTVGLPARADCNDIFKRAESMFVKKAEELKPEELAFVSEVAHSIDQAAHPVSKAADRQAQKILSQLRRRSTETEKRLLTEQAEKGIPTREIGVIGIAGAHGGILASTIEALAPEASTIYFDAGDGSSRIFDADFFQLNSSETPTSGDTPLSYGPVQLRDLMPPFYGHAYPRDRSLANGLHFLKGSLSGDLLLYNKGTSVTLGSKGFLITTDKGIQVYVRKLAIGTGYGPIMIDFFEVQSQAIIRESTERVYRNGDLTGVAVSFDDLKQAREKFHRAKVGPKRSAPVIAQPATPIDSQLQRNDVIIVGGKDGGAVVARKVSERESFGKRYWLGQEGANGESFIQALENKKSYADLFDEIESGEIQATKAHAIDLEYIPHPDGRPGVKVVYKKADGTIESVIGHTVILAPGYQLAPTSFLNGLKPHYFANEYDPEQPGLWDTMKSREEKWKAENPDAAKDLTPNLYGIGVFGSRATGMFSISRGGSITVQIAKALTRDIVHTRPVTGVPAAGGAKATRIIRLKPTITAGITEPKIAQAALRMELLRLSRTFAFGGEVRLEIRFSGSRAILSLDGLQSAGASGFLEKLASDGDFQRYLNDLQVRRGGFRWVIPVTERGGLRMDRLKMSSL
jgi:hypothetical protein